MAVGQGFGERPLGKGRPKSGGEGLKLHLLKQKQTRTSPLTEQVMESCVHTNLFLIWLSLTEALGTASLGGSPGQHDSIHCPAVPLEAISTGTGSVSLENTGNLCAHHTLGAGCWWLVKTVATVAG